MSEFERMTKDVNRSAYTRRILEIVSNIKKQKVGIDQVLIDTRAIQKDINQLSGKLDRTFTVTDELIFRVSDIVWSFYWEDVSSCSFVIG